MSELPEGIPPARVPEPRDSASGIVLRPRAGGAREVLLGVRSRRSRFMPGQLAFPGGRIDRGDRPDEPGFAGRCVSREVSEETGLRLAPEVWREAGVRVTPPMFPMRFRTFFFVAEVAEDTSDPEPSTEELESLRFLRAAEVIDEWRAGRRAVPPPVLALLRALAEEDDAPLPDLVERIAAANRLEQRAPRIEFTPQVWVLPVRTPTLPPATHTNVWIAGGRRFMVIDPGSGDETEIRRLFAVIERRREAGGSPTGVLLTHEHRDHIGGAVPLALQLGVPILGHPETLRAFEGQPRGPELLPIDDGDEIDLDGVMLRALHTPGHARGHLAFHMAERGILIGGDLASGLSTILIDPDEGDMERYVASLARVRDLGCRLLLVGHGPPLPGGALDALIEHRTERQRKILEQLRSDEVELSSIARGAYADVPRMPLRLTTRQTLSHLLHLERLGRVRRAEASGRFWASDQGTESETLRKIEQRLRERFDPLHLEIRDDSDKHVGHPGATSGGGHYRVTIVAGAFEGLTLQQQHRLVHEALRDLLGGEIHALGLKTRPPSGWTEG